MLRNGAPAVRTYYRPDADLRWAGRIKSIHYPDGRKDSYDYEEGTYSDGVFTAQEGEPYIRQTVRHGTSSSPEYGIAGKSTCDRTVEDYTGNVVMTETAVYTGNSNYETIHSALYINDDLGRPTEVRYSDGTYTEREYGDCCGIKSETDTQGIKMTYTNDDLGRPLSVLNGGEWCHILYSE